MELNSRARLFRDLWKIQLLSLTAVLHLKKFRFVKIMHINKEPIDNNINVKPMQRKVSKI